MKNSDLFINECDYSDLNENDAFLRLSQAIRCETTSYMDTSKINYQEFDKIIDLIRQGYPNVMEHGHFEQIGYSVLIELKGEDEGLKPALFMSHLDVVPVVKGSENDWKYGPFSGAIEEGYIWGRGALDIKEQVFGTLEAMEYLLSKGHKLKRTVYLAFGQDEETMQSGAYNIGQLLKSRGVELEFLLDEGGGDIIDAKSYGAPGVNAATIALYEKGYADLKIKAKSKGGHSSRPFFGTSLGHLAKAISAIVDNPLRAQLPDCVKEALTLLKPYILEEPMKSYLDDINGNEEKILEYYAGQPDLFNQVRTTIAPTMIEGGSQAGNVMPQNMEAVINFRLAPQDSLESLLNHCRNLVGEDLELEYVSANEASRPSSSKKYGYQMLVKSLEHYYKDIVFIPSVFVGATDARNYECICDCCLRRGPFFEENDIVSEGIHGTNERISLKAYMQGIRLLVHFIISTCL